MSHHRVGFITILGRPNVGKSTFVNAAVGYRLAAVSPVPNTTRRRWLGILTDDDKQIIFTDTPGVHKARNKMEESMARVISNSIARNDVVLLLCDPTRDFGIEDELAATAAKNSGKPCVLALNKGDVSTQHQRRTMSEAYLAILPSETPVYELSAATQAGIPELVEALAGFLPVGPLLYDEDQAADALVRDIAEDIIRESCMEQVREEIPQSIAVQIERWTEGPKKIRIDAVIMVERDSQKAILIGTEGRVIEEIRRVACAKLKDDLEKFIDLRLYVKTMPDWQNRLSLLKEMGLAEPEGGKEEIE
ncbi:MAG: hypothetical protein RL095_2938 [Verrucomicrobiota bacterium]|jgi:GTP-binding protein Era